MAKTFVVPLSVKSQTRLTPENTLAFNKYLLELRIDAQLLRPRHFGRTPHDKDRRYRVMKMNEEVLGALAQETIPEALHMNKIRLNTKYEVEDVIKALINSPCIDAKVFLSSKGKTFRVPPSGYSPNISAIVRAYVLFSQNFASYYNKELEKNGIERAIDY